MRSGDAAFSSISQLFWDTGPCQGTVSEFLTYPAICWIVVWGVPYYVLMFCILRGWLERNNKATLFTYTIDDPEGNGRFIVKLPEMLRPLGYMLQHFVWSITTGFLSIAMWNSFALHTLFLVVVFAFGIHRGSTFMFRVVAAKHVQNVVTEVAANSPKKGRGGAYVTVLPKEDA